MNTEEVSLSKATIDTGKLLKNIDSFKRIMTKHTKFMAVIKADAYGHGSVPLAHKMEAADAIDYFGVAQLSEALELRKNGIETDILVFNAVRFKDVKSAILHKITLTVFTEELAQEIVTLAEKMKTEVKVHLKIDTGMARLGVTDFEEALKVYQNLQSSYVNIEGIYTHFADANELTNTHFTKEQFTHFEKIINQFNEQEIYFDINHACNTAGTINFPEYHLDMVRVGFGLYGYNPTKNPEKIELAPIQNIRTTVTNIKVFPADQSVGYDRTYYSKEKMRIATIAIGYADGVPISLSNNGSFTFQEKNLPIVGQVCMDQIMLDSSKSQNLKIDDEVFYFGDPAEGFLFLKDVAQAANTSPYELLCRIGSRVKRYYK